MSRKKQEIFELDADSALAQAATTLFQAAEMAEKLNDTDAIMHVVAGWMELNSRLSGGRPQSDFPFGFGGSHSEIDTDAVSETEFEVEEEETDMEEEDE